MRTYCLVFCVVFTAAHGGEHPARLYNKGVIFYGNEDYSAALEAFEQALATRDPALRERALYNIGNTCFRLGQKNPQHAQHLWERAIDSYKRALELDPKDEDAKHNHEFVKKELEKRQQQQQGQQKGDQNQNQNLAQQQPQKDDSRQDAKSRSEKQDQQQQQAQDQKSKEQEQQQQQQAQSQSDKLDKQQARALLDQLRENEQHWNFFPEVQMKDLKPQGPPAKDW